ncbi:MAG: DHA2 family efflux MFS transporter permease subunit [Geodermatophilaceae bacterium]|nr:DHA2 family efflux MFS transporter permease subunit [Geodermatophilaceae bacterium]
MRLDTTQGRWLLTATILGSSLALLDGTVVNVALGRIGTELDAGFAGLQWTLNGYTLTLAALILLGGSLGDLLGRRRIFLIGTVWFAIASLLCGLAPNIEILVAARALQGIGGALLTPGSLALISASLHHDDRARAIGAWSGLGGVAAAIGPFLGGYLVDAWSWRLVFLINLPVSAAVVVVTLRHVPESSDPDAAKLDVPGAVLGALGLAGITYALISGGDTGWGALTVSTGIAGVLALTAFFVVEARGSHPLVPLDLFTDRQFTAANLVTFVVYGAMGGLFFLLVLDLQVVAGFSPLVSGTALLPLTVLMLLLSSRAGAMAQRIGPRWPMTVGPLVCAAGVLLMLRIGPEASYVTDVLPGAVVFGLGLSFTVAPLTATVLASAADRHAGIASGVNNAVARVAGLLAVAMLPAAAGLSGADYQNPAAFDAGFTVVLLICAALLIAGGLIAVFGIDRRLVPATGPEAVPPSGLGDPPTTN